MKKFKALIVHSDPQVRTLLREMFLPFQELVVLGEAISSFEALALLQGVGHEVLILGDDLEGDVSGFDMAGLLADREFSLSTVFVASDQKDAFKAFELGAVDYLLLPATEERVRQTVEKLKQIVPRTVDVQHGRLPEGEEDYGEEETLKLPLGEDEEDLLINALRKAWDSTLLRQPEIEKLPISQDGRTYLVPYNQIVFVEAYEDYSYVHTSSQKYLTSYRLKNLEERLRMHRFFRVHRKYLVNLDMVTEIASMPGSNFMLRTIGRKKIELPISRRRIGELKQLLRL